MSKVLNILGTLIMVILLAVALLLNAPRVFGYQVYSVLSDSMKPEYSKGSIVYVQSIDASKVQVGDIIAFSMGEGISTVATHRVTEMDTELQVFVTKGDNNTAADPNPVGFNRLKGIVICSIPLLGNISQFIHTKNGIAVVILTFALVLILWVVGDILKKRKEGQLR